jgi:hypothetical protein
MIGESCRSCCHTLTRARSASPHQVAAAFQIEFAFSYPGLKGSLVAASPSTYVWRYGYEIHASCSPNPVQMTRRATAN